ncbi:hypothetical protein [Leptolyngbya ohadii]|uniref:hypothetical protein n=1 Tax=Leptolyngbya ohadii TaxID=1962290 RepID=UPI000B59FF8F|nr:hypothetical protein [Leptolyngbya ohadii]
MIKASPPPKPKPGYRPQSEDKSIEADAFEFMLLRQRTDAQRFQMAMSCNRSVRKLSLCGLKATGSDLSALRVAQVFLGDRYPAGFEPKGNEMTWIQDSISLAGLLHRIFSELEVPYFITGGVASSTFGDPRSTRDLDIVMQIAPADITRLVQRLEAEGFYVPGVEDVQSGRLSTLVITHMETIANADLVIAPINEFTQGQFQRRKPIEIPEVGEIYFCSPEDLILNKLLWRQDTQSEKQWRDILGILKVQGERLDYAYLIAWADCLDVLEPLNQALIEAGV